MLLRPPNRGPKLKALIPHKRAGLLPNTIKLLPVPRPLPQILTLTLTRPMGSQQEEQQENPTKRPFCHRCSKPLRLCLCFRLKAPPLDNSIGITILQHSLEKHHPLNSTRVARLGFKNLAVVPVTDVNFTARFTVRPVDQDRLDSGERSDFSKTHIAGFESLDDNRIADSECGNGDFVKDLSKYRKLWKKSKYIEIQDGVVEAIFDKYRVSCSSNDVQVTIERNVEPDISWVLETPVGRAFASNGFTVSKLQRKQLPNSEEFQDFAEFNIVMPPGAVLLFPGKSAMGLDEVDFEVKHLVVLDGTWAKARRMHHENPWLTLLPHVKLDPGKESLYSEVRHQPRAGCLSTIESIIYALKGLGSDMEGLDELLDLFELMIGDQRRCKDDNIRAKAMS